MNLNNMKYIDIDKDEVPYTFDLTLADETYTFTVKYNEHGDYFTIDLIKNDELIIEGERIVYAKPLFISSQYKDIPKVTILPFDLNDSVNRITFENFNEIVFLYIIEGAEDETMD